MGMKQLGFGAIRQIFSEVRESTQHPYTSGQQEQVGLGQGEGLLPRGGLMKALTVTPLCAKIQAKWFCHGTQHTQGLAERIYALKELQKPSLLFIILGKITINYFKAQHFLFEMLMK